MSRFSLVDDVLYFLSFNPHNRLVSRPDYLPLMNEGESLGGCGDTYTQGHCGTQSSKPVGPVPVLLTVTANITTKRFFFVFFFFKYFN